MKRRKQRLHVHCLLCGEDDEHLLHVLICPDATAVDFRKPLLPLWIRDLAYWWRHSPRYCWVSSDRFDLLVRGSFWDRTRNSPFHIFNLTGSDPSLTGNWLVRLSLRFHSGTIGYLPTSALLFHPIPTKRRTLGNTPYSSMLENLTPHLDAPEFSITWIRGTSQ